jgi:hypothetical protein
VWSNHDVLLRAVLLFATGLPPLLADENLIDRRIEQKAKANGVPLAANATDAEFIRRVTLDLHGRLPDPAVARKFLDDGSPDKLAQYINSLFPAIPVQGMRSVRDHPFLDRWTYFFNDLFRNGELLKEGINTFYGHVKSRL